jgi:N-acetylmuramoyl-L-alanine amidase
MDVLPLRTGDSGDAVRDLQQRLTAAGLETSSEPRGTFGPSTEQAVRSFQAQRGLPVSGTCDGPTWAALVEAGYRLGDRLQYLKSPMMRGDDVAGLQRALGRLGFDAGRVDGIFGPDTERALRDFQRNAGLTADGVAGPQVVQGLERLGDPTGRATNVAGVRERERLRSQPPRLTGRRIVLGEAGGLDVLVSAVDRLLHEAGAVVAVLHHPHPSVQAVEANDFGADLYLGLALGDGPRCQAAFYATDGWESSGGRQFATLLTDRLRRLPDLDVDDAAGRWIPILRETRMPSVLCTLGPPATVVDGAARLATAVHGALQDWVNEPVRP